MRTRRTLKTRARRSPPRAARDPRAPIRRQKHARPYEIEAERLAAQRPRRYCDMQQRRSPRQAFYGGQKRSN